MSEPKPVYYVPVYAIEQDDGELTVTEPPAGDPRAAYVRARPTNINFPHDPSLSILLNDLINVCLYSGASQIAILRGIETSGLEFLRAGAYGRLELANCGTLVLIRFPGHDGGPPAEHFSNDQ